MPFFGVLAFVCDLQPLALAIPSTIFVLLPANLERFGFFGTATGCSFLGVEIQGRCALVGDEPLPQGKNYLHLSWEGGSGMSQDHHCLGLGVSYLCV